MSQVDEKLIREVLSGYGERRFLIAASLEYPILHGNFLIGPTFYYSPHFEHAADIEIQFCLNQLCYVGVAELIKKEEIPELKGLNFAELQNENMLIVESRKRFRRPIRTDKVITGELKVDDWRKYNHGIAALVNFQFENRSCFGHLELVLLNPKQK